MSYAKGPFIRLFIGLVIIGIFFSIPLREFFKITFMLGIPFIFILGFMLKKKTYSLLWVISLILLLLVATGYGYMLTTLPGRIEVKNIVRTGTALEAQGDYAAAIDEYQKLEQYGEVKKMENRISSAKVELESQATIEQARQYIAKGDKITAQELLETIPPYTRMAKEAKEILKTLD